MYKYLSRTLDGAQDCLPGISDRGVCPGAACWHGWLPHDLACLVPDEKRRAFFSNREQRIEQLIANAGGLRMSHLIQLNSPVTEDLGKCEYVPTSKLFPAGLPVVR